MRKPINPRPSVAVPATVAPPCATTLLADPSKDPKAVAPPSTSPTPIPTELAAHHSEREDSHTTKGQPCVLIVMHNTTERLLLKHACQMEGCAVHTSETGQKALQMIAANEGTYALCLIDAVLPDVEPKSFCLQMLELVRGRAMCRLKMHYQDIIYFCESTCSVRSC